jgi:uncharacterized C2H2 Zn-finger protein
LQNTLIDLKKHIHNYHINNAAFNCDSCDQNFQTSLLYEQHVKSQHQPDVLSPCNICGIVFANRNHLETHTPLCISPCTLESSDTNAELVTENNCMFSDNTCYKCDKVSTNLGDSSTHTIINHQQLAYKCYECDYSFETNIALSNHMNNNHDGARFLPPDV